VTPLCLHPDSRCQAVTEITAAVKLFNQTMLEIKFSVSGQIGEILIPQKSPPERRDDLWKTTCFELFMKNSSQYFYREYNFSPSTAWAAYTFQSYRHGMAYADIGVAPSIETDMDMNRLNLIARLPFEAADAGTWTVGLSAVIADQAGRTAYWALAHPPGPPDFHHGDCFAHQLLAAEPS
jgi:hypothetical protein